MADEPSDEPVAHATAHECNGDREGLACRHLSDSGASIFDGAAEIYCYGFQFQSQPPRPGAARCVLKLSLSTILGVEQLAQHSAARAQDLVLS